MPVTLKPYSDQETNAWRRRATLLVILGISFFCLPYGFYYALFTPYLLVQFLAPIAILAILAIWALPDLRTAPTGLLSPLAFAFITALILWPNYLAIALPGLPWITMIRLTSFPMALTFLVCLSVSAEFRTRIGTIVQGTPNLWKAIAILVLIQCLSIAFSKNPMQSIQKLLVAQTAWTGIFFVSCYVFVKPGRVQRWAMIIWVMALLVGTLGLMERQEHRVLWGAHIPSFLKVGDEVVQRILQGASRSTTGQYRIQSTFSTALGLSEFCALAMPFVLHFLAGKYHFLVRIAALLTIPFLLYVIINTDARLGLLGFFLSLMVYLFLWGVLRWTKSRESLVGPATVMVYPIIFSAFIASSFLVGRIKNKVWGTGQYNASNVARMTQVKAGTPQVLDHPVGHGIGMGGDALGYTNKAGVQTVDSYFLQVGLDIGILGLLAYSSVLILSVYYAIKYSFTDAGREKENSFLVPLAVCIINFIAIKFVFANDDNHPMIFMAMGIIAAIVYRIRSETEVGFGIPKPRRNTFRRRRA